MSNSLVTRLVALILGLVAIGIALTAISAGWVINNSISILVSHQLKSSR